MQFLNNRRYYFFFSHCVPAAFKGSCTEGWLARCAEAKLCHVPICTGWPGLSPSCSHALWDPGRICKLRYLPGVRGKRRIWKLFHHFKEWNGSVWCWVRAGGSMWKLVGLQRGRALTFGVEGASCQAVWGNVYWCYTGALLTQGSEHLLYPYTPSFVKLLPFAKVSFGEGVESHLQLQHSHALNTRRAQLPTVHRGEATGCAHKWGCVLRRWLCQV